MKTRNHDSVAAASERPCQRCHGTGRLPPNDPDCGPEIISNMMDGRAGDACPCSWWGTHRDPPTAAGSK